MKKIVLVGLITILFVGCHMNKTNDIVIENKSNYQASIFCKNFKEDDKQMLGKTFVLHAKEKLALPFFSDGSITITSISRNYLKKISSTKYEILNSNPVFVKVYNTTSKKVIISDINNLFDSLAIPENGEQDIKVFNSLQKIQAIAVTQNDGIRLNVDIQPNKLIIKY